MVARSNPGSAPSNRPWNWQIASIAGIPLVVEASALLTLSLITCSYSWRWQPLHPEWSLTQVWITSLITAICLFGSVFLHELAHSLVAGQQGISVRSITLFFLGGLATIEREARTPAGLLQLAIAGPVTSMILAGLLWAGSWVLPEFLAVPARQLAVVNSVLGGFNLLPLLPLDGGHVLSALIWQVTGDRIRGVQLSARLGQMLGGAALGGGLAWLIVQGDGAGGWFALVGGFIFRNAGRYQALARLQKTLFMLTIADVPSRPWQAVDAATTVESFVQGYLNTASSDSAQIVLRVQQQQGWNWAGLDLERMQGLERSLWATTFLTDFQQDLLILSGQLPLVEAILRLDAVPGKQALVWCSASADDTCTVLEPDAIQGWIDSGSLLAAVASALEIAIPESDLEQTRLTGIYPPLLRLKTVAEALDWIHGKPAQPPLSS